MKALYGVVGHGSYREWLAPITEAKHRGWGSESEEVSPGQESLAVAVVDHMGRPAAALAVTFRVGSLDKSHVNEVIGQLQSRAAMLESALFGR